MDAHLFTLMLTGAKSDIADTLRIRVVPADWGTVGLPGCEGPEVA